MIQDLLPRMARTGVVAVLFAVCVAGSALAQSGKNGQTVEDLYTIQAVIARQIEAFRRDDADEAYSYAAPEVKQMFPSKERFMTMVKKGYGAIYRPQFYFFGQLGGNEAQKVQEVQIIGPDGRSWVALYRMQRQDGGDWRIGAVILGLRDKGQKT